MPGSRTTAWDLSPALLDIIVCPACHGKLAIDYDTSELTCTSGSCGLAFPITEGVPVLLVDEARSPARL